MGFSRQEHWSGLPFPPPGDLSDPRIEFLFREPLVLASRFFFFLTIEPTWNFLTTCCFLLNPLGNPYAFPALYSKDTDAQRGDAANPKVFIQGVRQTTDFLLERNQLKLIHT